LDKTYLVSHFESLRKLVRVPFESAADKVAVPGVRALISGLRSFASERGYATAVYFLSASPPQIGNAIRDKLALDDIEYDGITFKDQMDHLIHGRFDALREQIGYKLTMLLRGALDIDEDVCEYLFGDDWESDPFVYSLYADIIAARLERGDIESVLARAQVHKHYMAPIAELLDDVVGRGVRHRVGGIFILRQRRAEKVALDAFGARLAWFDNYFECSLRLYSMGLLGAESVVEVAREIGLEPVELERSYAEMAERGGVDLSRLGAVRVRLLASGLAADLRRPNPAGALAAACRRMLGFAPAPRPVAAQLPLPDYSLLAERWSRRRRRGKDAKEPEDDE